MKNVSEECNTDQWYNLAKLAEVSIGREKQEQDEQSIQAARALAQLAMNRKSGNSEGREDEDMTLRICVPQNTKKIIICTPNEFEESNNMKCLNNRESLNNNMIKVMSPGNMMKYENNDNNFMTAFDMTNEKGSTLEIKLPDLRKNLENEDIARNRFSCPICGKNYSTSSNLARHRQTHRSLEDSKARKCPECGKIYVSMPAFSMHLRTHGSGHICQKCGKIFSRPWLLKGHLRTHTGEKPYNCPVCEKSFSDKSNLRAHLQTHSPIKPFKCQKCGKQFSLKSYLIKHEESSCSHDGEITQN